MNPKEKAKELFNKMDMIIYTDQDNWKEQCRQCALICVDEIINDAKNGYDEEIITDYWQEVKLEMIKL